MDTWSITQHGSRGWWATEAAKGMNLRTITESECRLIGMGLLTYRWILDLRPLDRGFPLVFCGGR